MISIMNIIKNWEYERMRGLSPRKTRYETPKHIVDAIRSRKAKLLAGPYICPMCGQERLRIRINEEDHTVWALCKCGVKENLEYKKGCQGIDYYNDYLDKI